MVYLVLSNIIVLCPYSKFHIPDVSLSHILAACSVIRIVENIARKYNIETTLICDTNHVLTSDYSDVVTVSAGADAVDFKLVNLCTRDDIVVTQDYGVAAMALSKGAYAIHQSGKWYTNDNIDQMLM